MYSSTLSDPHFGQYSAVKVIFTSYLLPFHPQELHFALTFGLAKDTIVFIL